MNKFKIMTIVLLSLVVNASGMTRQQLSQVMVTKDGNFNYWTEGSAVLAMLKSYVSEVTDEQSEKFIPKEDRIAVFDMDGTLISETTSYYTGWMLWEDFVRRYPDKVSAENVALAEKLYDMIYNRKTVEGDFELIQAQYQNECFEGMTMQEYHDYVRTWMDSTPTTGMDNMKIGEAIYVPMLEIVSYLTANDFIVYIVSGADRGLVRATIDGVMNIPKRRCIGSDIEVKSSMQGDNDSRTYTMKAGEKVVRGAATLINVKSNKIKNITEEIGQQPVLAFGNSTGDFSMFRYVTQDNAYASAAFCLLCDDTERDYGNLTKAASVKATCDENGWHTVSMRDDWKTIYGYDVTKTESTAVQSVNSRNISDTESSVAYTLQGIRATSSDKGVIITNGMKQTK